MSIMIIDKKTSDLSISYFETMREAKVAYNYINDILENSEIRMDTQTAKELENSLEILGDVYNVAHSSLEAHDKEEQLLTDACCKNCNKYLSYDREIEVAMENNYKDFLEENKEILEYIKNNDLVDLIDKADSTAKKYANVEGTQFLHSYRYSQVYDVLTCDGYEKGRRAIAITKLLENSYDKNINDLINDSFENSMEMM